MSHYKDEADRYIEHKHQIFSKLVSEISLAEASGKPRVYLKGLQIMDEQVDAIAERDEWSTCLEKARLFFEGIEDYEACQVCSMLLEKLKTPKKIRKNGRKK